MTVAAPKPDPQSGMTLIELVVAMAVFALVAVMGAQALSGMLVQRDALSARAAEDREILYAAAMLRRDLQQALPLLFFPPEAGVPQSALLGPGQAGAGFSLSTAVPRPAEVTADLGRVIWHLDPASGDLTRQSWPTLWPVTAGQVGPEVVVLTGVQSLQIRSYWPDQGWRDGTQPDGGLGNQPGGGTPDGDQAGAAPEVYSDQLPLAIELRLQTRRFGDLILIETLP